MSKKDATNIMKKVNFQFSLHIKVSHRTTYYQRNRERILNRGKEYCENNKEK